MGILKVDTNLFRGPRPDDFSSLVPLGIKTDINLEVGYFEFFHGKVEQEKRETDHAGIFYLHRPIDDLWFPSNQQLDQILEDIKQGQFIGGVFVHCEHGKDRTGLVCAIYRVRVQRWSVEDAISEWFEMGHSHFPYDLLGWTVALKKYLNT